MGRECGDEKSEQVLHRHYPQRYLHGAHEAKARQFPQPTHGTMRGGEADWQISSRSTCAPGVVWRETANTYTVVWQTADSCDLSFLVLRCHSSLPPIRRLI